MKNRSVPHAFLPLLHPLFAGLVIVVVVVVVVVVAAAVCVCVCVCARGLAKGGWG